MKDKQGCKQREETNRQLSRIVNKLEDLEVLAVSVAKSLEDLETALLAIGTFLEKTAASTQSIYSVLADMYVKA